MINSCTNIEEVLAKSSLLMHCTVLVLLIAAADYFSDVGRVS